MSNQLTVKEELRNSLSRMEGQFKMALPKHIPVEKFMRVVQTAISSNSSILSADRTSLFAACVRSAEEGLFPNGNEAALVPFKGKIAFMPMVAGILKKIRNSGELASLCANLVGEKDEFDYYVDEKGEHLKHTPVLLGDKGKTLGAYALAVTKDGASYIEFMSFEDIEKVRKSSASGNSGPWSQWWSEMAKKTVIRRLSKRLPMSTDLEGTIQADDQFYNTTTPPIEETEIPAPQIRDVKKPEALEAAIVGEQNEVPI